MPATKKTKTKTKAAPKKPLRTPAAGKRVTAKPTEVVAQVADGGLPPFPFVGAGDASYFEYCEMQRRDQSVGRGAELDRECCVANEGA